jgi:hypothetical protein
MSADELLVEESVEKTDAQKKYLKKFIDRWDEEMDKYDSGGMMAKGGYVAVSGNKNNDGWWYIVSKPSSKEDAQKMVDSLYDYNSKVLKEEVKVITVEEAKSMKKVLGKEYLASGGMMAKGGEIEVGDKVKYKNAKYHATITEIVDDVEIPYAKIVYADGVVKKAYLEDLEKVTLGVASEYVNPKYMAKGGKLSLDQFEKKYRENEDMNYHSQNVVLLAENFGSEQDLKDAKRILALHEAIGSLPSFLGQERRELDDKLWSKYEAAMKASGKEIAARGMMLHGGEMHRTGK